MKHERYVVVGASLAGLRAAEAMRQHGFGGEIVLIGAEKALPYHRPPLSKEMLGTQPLSFDELLIQPARFFEEQDIELRLGTRAVRLIACSREIELDTGERIRYDRALIATGAEPRRLPVPGSELPGVVHLRTFQDATELALRIRQSASIVIVGAGLVGLEVAAAARSAGRQVTVVEAADMPLRRVLGERLGFAVTRMHAEHGVDIRLATVVTRVRGAAHVEEVVLSDGQRIPADLVVVGIGVQPATGWLRGSELMLDDGVVVDEFGLTNIPGVYAAGDVARSFNPRFGTYLRLEQYGNAHHQGLAVGRNMVGIPAPYAPMPAASSEQFGARLQVVGHIQGGEEVVIRGSERERAFVAFYLRQGAITGAFAMNRARELAAARKLVMAGIRPPQSQLADEQTPLSVLQ